LQLYILADFLLALAITVMMTLIRLNLPTLQSRTRFLAAVFLISVFKNKFSCLTVFDTVSLGVPTRPIRDFSTFDVHHRFMVSPSARYVSDANAVCRHTDTFQHTVFSFV
jgi:hypothetical protein